MIAPTAEQETTHASRICRITSVEPLKIKTYWKDLEDSDTLKYRLSAIKEPRWSDVMDMMRRMGRDMYVAMVGDDIAGEFMLEAFTGKSAQMHFSMHPDTRFTDTIQIGIRTCDTILSQWLDNHGNPYLRSLYANIAVSNRASCITAMRMGFKKIGMLPYGMYIARHDRYEDGTLLVRI